jgi:hypothetical protein
MSHRSTIYPCFLPDLGEFNGSWSHETYPDTKIVINSKTQAQINSKFQIPSTKLHSN